MRITVPITGELIGPESGNPDNPVKPLDFRKLLPRDCQNFSWQAIKHDFEEGTVELEVTVEKGMKQIVFPPEGEEEKPEYFRPETDEEFNQRRIATEDTLRSTFEGQTVDELYQMAGEPKLTPFKK